MHTLSDAQPGAIATLLGHIATVLPASLRPQVEQAVPTISVSAARLGLEVLDAERRAIRFSSAVERSAEFPLIGRVYFGALNLLQCQMPQNVRKAMSTLLTQALSGQFESTRRLLFLIARREDDPEAALCRFLLWCAVRINLLILTWNEPQVEAIGVLDSIEERAEDVLRELLTVEEIEETDCRPLHALVAAMLVDAYAAAQPLLMGAMSAIEVGNVDALQFIRRLEARDAALFHPGRFSGAAGSQQIVDRFPHHYASVAAMEQRRTRMRAKITGNAGGPSPSTHRFIDLLLDVDGS